MRIGQRHHSKMVTRREEEAVKDSDTEMHIRTKNPSLISPVCKLITDLHAPKRLLRAAES